jgi:hypothetical protein
VSISKSTSPAPYTSTRVATVAAAQEFGREVARRRQHPARRGDPHAAGRARTLDVGDEPEVRQLEPLAAPPVLAHEQVGRLEIPVHQPTVVHRRERRQELAREIHRARHRERPEAPDLRGERAGAHVLEYQHRGAVLGGREVQHVDHALVAHARHRPPLAHEALHRCGVRAQPRVQHLHRDEAPDGQVLGLVDRGAAPTPTSRTTR